MDHSPLSRLPPELRNRIYELVLIAEEPIEIRFSQVHEAQADIASLALTATCRSIRAETLGLFYSSNEFILHTDYFSQFEYAYWHARSHECALNVLAWITAIGSDNCKLAKDVTIDLGRLPHIETPIDFGPFQDIWTKTVRQPHGLCSPRGPLTAYRQFWFRFHSSVWGDSPDDYMEFELRFPVARTRGETEKLWANVDVIKGPSAFGGEGIYEAYEGRVDWAVDKIREIVLDRTMW